MNLKLITLMASALALSTTVQANLIQNGSFEDGLVNWQTSGNAAVGTVNPSSYDGVNYLFGSNTPLFSASQDLDLLSLGFFATEIDTGDFKIDFGGWQSGFQTQQDSGQISIYLFDDLMNEIGSASLPSFFSNLTWVEQSGITSLLAGSRFVRYEFVGTRTDGLNNDAYLDAAYLDITTSAVPVPAAAWLFGSGLLGLVAMARRKA